jgi:hypothetical protein
MSSKHKLPFNHDPILEGIYYPTISAADESNEVCYETPFIIM